MKDGVSKMYMPRLARILYLRSYGNKALCNLPNTPKYNSLFFNFFHYSNLIVAQLLGMRFDGRGGVEVKILLLPTKSIFETLYF